MPEKRYYIPGQGKTIWTPSGQLQIEIFYPENTASQVDLPVDLIKISPIQYHLEVDPQKGKFRFGYVKLKFYNTNNLFETSGVLNSAKKQETFCRIKLNGASFFTGYLKWDKIRKTHWYYSNAGMQYRIIELTFTDVLEYAGQKTIADAGYTEGVYFEDLLRNAAGLLYLSDAILREDYLIQEPRGAQYSLAANTYDDGLRLADMDPNLNLLEFMKWVTRYLGMFIFQQNNYLWVRQRDVVVPSITISQDKIAKLEKIPHKNQIDFVEIKATKDWKTAFGGSVAIQPTTYVKQYGIQSSVNERNIIIDGSNLLSYLCVPAPSAGREDVPPGVNTPSSVDTVNYEWIEDSSYASFLNTDYVETGMLLRIDHFGYYFFAIYDVTNIRLTFQNPDGVQISTLDEYKVFRRKTSTGGFPDYDWLFKAYLSVLKSGEIYNKIYLNRGERIRLQYAELLQIADTIDFDGRKWVIERATFDLKKNLSTIEAVAIA